LSNWRRREPDLQSTMSRLDGLQLAGLRSSWFEAVDNAVLEAAIGGRGSVSLVLADLGPDAPQQMQTLVEAMSKDYRQKHFQVTWDNDAGRLDLAWGGGSPALKNTKAPALKHTKAPEAPAAPDAADAADAADAPQETHIGKWRTKPRLEFSAEPDSKWTPWATFCEWDGEWVVDTFFADYLRKNADALAACQHEADKVHAGAPLIDPGSKPCTWRAARAAPLCGRPGTSRGALSAACPDHLCPKCRVNIQYGSRGACRTCLAKREREEPQEAAPPSKRQRVKR